MGVNRTIDRAERAMNKRLSAETGSTTRCQGPLHGSVSQGPGTHDGAAKPGRNAGYGQATLDPQNPDLVCTARGSPSLVAASTVRQFTNSVSSLNGSCLRIGDGLEAYLSVLVFQGTEVT